jgi:hypothetical protein
MKELAPDKRGHVGQVHAVLVELDEAVCRLEANYSTLRSRLECVLTPQVPSEQQKVTESSSGVALVESIRAITRRVTAIDHSILATTDNLEV